MNLSSRDVSVARTCLLALVLLSASFVSTIRVVGSAQSPTPVLNANCGTGSSTLVSNTTQVALGSSGTVKFSCGTSGSALTSTAAGSVVPQYSLPAGYTTLAISSSPVCAAGTVLSSGSPVTFGEGIGVLPITSYNYCARYANAPPSGLQGFSVSWTQTAPVSPHTTNTIVTCTAPVTVNQASTCKVVVIDTDSSPTTPTGTVTFSSDGPGIFNGSPCALSGSGTSATCQVTYTPTAVGTGTHTITGTYSGDQTHAASHGLGTITVTTAPDFTISVNPTSLILSPEDSEVCRGEAERQPCDDEGHVTITITALNGFVGAITLSGSSSPRINTDLDKTTIATSGTASLRIGESSPGSYVVTITGTSGSISHHVTVNVTVREPEKLKCGGEEEDCEIESDAPLSNASFEGHRMHFTMSGDKGSVGAANVTVRRSLVPDIDRIKVFVDHDELSKSDVAITSDNVNYHIYFKVSFHSNVDVDIDLSPSTTIFGLSPGIFYSLVGGVSVAAALIIGVMYAIVKRRSKSKHFSNHLVSSKREG